MSRTLRLQALSLTLAAAALVGCGGGGGAASPAPVPPVGGTPLPAVNVSAVAAADPGSSLPAGWERGAFMQIFVRSYQDSNGDGIGDLRGLVSRLDYLKDLGVSGLWLMPVARSQDQDHGYAVADYRDIEPAYGTLADFDELLREAHVRGIGVIVDYVMNHSAGQHPLFVNSRDSAGNAYRHWYVWQATAPAGWNVFGSNPWRSTTSGAYYAPFWDQMPDFNLTNPAVVGWHHDNLRFWLNRGVDGFRFDAVGMLVENGPSAWESQPQNLTLMNEVRALVAGYRHRTMVCEAPADPRRFGAANACGSAFAFDLKDHLVRAARGDTTSIQAVADYFKTAPAGMAPMLSNHDSFAGQRLWDQLGGNLAQMRLAAAGYLLLPGTPFVYYGEEIGMAGAAVLSGDPKLRTPMSWTADTTHAGFTTGAPYRALSANVATRNVAAQQADPDSLLAFYRSLMTLRRTRAEIARGSYEAAFASGAVMGYQRAFEGARSLVLLNHGAVPASVDVAGLPASATLAALLPASGAAAAVGSDGVLRLTLPAQSVRVYGVSP
jgi:glycosidase